MMRITKLVMLAVLLGGGAAHADPPPHAQRKAGVTAAPTAHRPTAVELTEIARAAIATSRARLPKGATVSTVHATASADVPLATDRVTIEVTTPPRRAGSVTTPAVLTFWRTADVAGRLPITLELSVPPEALVFDTSKGATLTLVVRRGLVEVTAPAVLATDADIGDVVQVLLRPSGRALRAQLVAKDRAIAVEDAR